MYIKIYEDVHYDRKCEDLSPLKIKKIKVNNILIKKYKDMLENPNFEQHYSSRTAISVFRLRHDSFRLMKWLA